MASTSSTPNWLEMPHELMLTIFHKLGVVEILEHAQLVCTNWRRVSKDPALWKVIDMSKSFYSWNMDEVYYVNLTKQAVYRSSGELFGIILNWFCTDDLLHYISQSSSKLKSFSLSSCNRITDHAMSDMVKRLPQLEHLYVNDINMNVQDIELIGLNCSQLKTFWLKQDFCCNEIESNVDAFAVAKSMPELRHLQLCGNRMTDEGLQAILDGCPLLEFLDVRECFNLNIAGNLIQRCKKQIKEFKCSSEDDLLEYRLQEEYENYNDGSFYENFGNYSD